MRLISFEGTDHWLREQEWRQLLKRFDLSRARLNASGYFFVPAASLCFKRDYMCLRCPLSCPQKKTNSCTYLFTRLLGETNSHKIYFSDSGILWDPRNDKEVRAALQKVIDFLNQSQPVKRSKLTGTSRTTVSKSRLSLMS